MPLVQALDEIVRHLGCPPGVLVQDADGEVVVVEADVERGPLVEFSDGGLPGVLLLGQVIDLGQPEPVDD